MGVDRVPEPRRLRDVPRAAQIARRRARELRARADEALHSARGAQLRRGRRGDIRDSRHFPHRIGGPKGERMSFRGRVVVFTVACGAAAASAFAQTKPAIDVCGIVTPDKAKAVMGSLASQPPVKTDHVGFGVDSCMYIGPKQSGAGAQTIFSRLTVQTGTGKDGPDMLQMDADKRKATASLAGVGEAAKRNQEGTFVWAKQGAVACTAEIANGLPKALTADSAATALGGLCRDIFASVKK